MEMTRKKLSFTFSSNTLTCKERAAINIKNNKNQGETMIDGVCSYLPLLLIHVKLL